VVVKASSAQQIEALVTDLIAGGMQREVAVARLTVLGARAVERLIAIADSDASSAARAAAFRTLEGIADPRALDAALRAIASPDETIASAAIGAGRVFHVLARQAGLTFDVRPLRALEIVDQRFNASGVAANEIPVQDLGLLGGAGGLVGLHQDLHDSLEDGDVAADAHLEQF